MFPHDHFLYRYKARADLINPEQTVIVESRASNHSASLPMFIAGFILGSISTVLFF